MINYLRYPNLLVVQFSLCRYGPKIHGLDCKCGGAPSIYLRGYSKSDADYLLCDFLER